jgi:cell pole-organizing protein PopZ
VAEAEREAEAESWAQVDGEWVEDEPVPFIPLRRRAEHLAARLAAGVALDPEEAEETDIDEPPVQPLRDVAAELLEDDPLAADLDGDAPVARGIDDGEASGPAQRMPTEILDADGTPLAVLDEAALQEIVRQMIREELQGALGERITRNVRKLVRAEINRALVARDLD